MEFIYTWLGTTITSLILSTINELRMYKDAADAGYKIDGRNLNKYNQEYEQRNIKNFSLALLIPFVNLFITVINVVMYGLTRENIIEHLGMIKVLEDLTEEEKKKYQKFPTGLHALIIMIKEAIRVSKYNHIQVQGTYDTSEIYFDIKDDGDIEIIKVYGRLCQLTEESQKEVVLKTFDQIAAEGLEAYGTKEALLEAMTVNKEIDLKGEKIKKEIKELTKLRDELIQQTKQTQQDKPSHKTKGKRKK